MTEIGYKSIEVQKNGITGEYDPTVITTWSPNAGEVWYIDEVIEDCDGTGSVSNQEFRLILGLAVDDFTLSQERASNDLSPKINGNTQRDDQLRSNRTSFDNYITEEERLYLVLDTSSTDSNATWDWTIKMRRVC